MTVGVRATRAVDQCQHLPILAEQPADLRRAARPVVALGDPVLNHVGPQPITLRIEGAAPGQRAGGEAERFLRQGVAFEQCDGDDAAEIQQQSLAPRRRHCAGLIRVFSNAAPIASTICVASWRESTNGGERMMMLLEVRIIAPAS